MRSTKNVSDVSPLVESQSYARKRYHECQDELNELQMAIVKADEDVRVMYTMRNQLEENIHEWAGIGGMDFVDS